MELENSVNSFEIPRTDKTKAPYVVELASSREAVRDSQRLRYQVFAEEMGADIVTEEEGIESDRFDEFCKHIMVRDSAHGGVIASTRLLLDEDARRAGGFYTEGEFDISALVRNSGRIIEVGRTCVHTDYRSGSAISHLWSGLARFIDLRSYEYMIGCASISMADGGATARAAYELLASKYLISEEKRCIPRKALPETAVAGDEKPKLPPLMKAYIRLGARITGEPCWDPAFDCADLMIALSPADLQKRYARHFLGG